MAKVRTGRGIPTRGVVNPNRVFEDVGVHSHGFSRFDLSNQVIGTQDMGLLYPVYCRFALPGDVWHLGQRTAVRWNPLLAPILHEVNTYFYSFFVPMRLLDDNWEEWITGGEDGETSVSLERWIPAEAAARAKGSLWDWFGFPVGVLPDSNYAPLIAPVRAYRMIFNEYFRDENLDGELVLGASSINAADSPLLANARWEKDYFASALPFPQRGVSPALPITGTTSAEWPSAAFAQGAAEHPVSVEPGPAVDVRLISDDADGRAGLESFFGRNTVDFAQATTFDIADLRQAAAMQQFMELSARGGMRYIEYLKASFDTSPRDSRLQRPEYIGRVKMPLIFSEVLQTSATDSEPTPQGNLAGHGIGVVEGKIGSYRCEEFGVIMTIMVHRPRAVYTQGFDREWMPQTRYDVYHPLFANLSEQMILRGEIYADGTSNDTAMWGYQGRFSELRFARSRVAGEMHDTFDYWHLARQFSAAPSLNSAFLSYSGTIRKDILAAPTEPALMVSVGNHVICDRPVPAVPVPGLGRI